MGLDAEGSERMMRIMRHRLLNIMSGVKSANSLLAGMLDERLEPQEREYFPLINRECDLVCALVDRFEAFFGVMPKTFPMTMAQAVVEAERKLRGNFPMAEIEMQIHIQDPGRVVCSETLSTVLHEAVDNAYGITRTPIQIFIGDGAEGCVARVTDQGQPVSSKVLSMAFEPFFTERTKHMGLGLSIARRRVDRLGGSTVIRGGADGTEVEFVLPEMKEMRGG
jgi:signal transduction histidine kinase